jgi:TPR repeat protein
MSFRAKKEFKSIRAKLSKVETWLLAIPGCFVALAVITFSHPACAATLVFQGQQPNVGASSANSQPSSIDWASMSEENLCEGRSPGLCALQGSREVKSGDKAHGLQLLHGACEFNDVLGCSSYGAYAADARNWKEAAWGLAKSCKLGIEESCKTVQAIRRKFSLQEPSEQPLVEVASNNATYCSSMAPIECTRAAAKEEAAGNSIKARSMMLEACDMNEGFACSKQGMYERDSVNGDHTLGHKLLKRACGLGIPEACENEGKR